MIWPLAHIFGGEFGRGTRLHSLEDEESDDVELQYIAYKCNVFRFFDDSLRTSPRSSDVPYPLPLTALQILAAILPVPLHFLNRLREADEHAAHELRAIRVSRSPKFLVPAVTAGPQANDQFRGVHF